VSTWGVRYRYCLRPEDLGNVFLRNTKVHVIDFKLSQTRICKCGHLPHILLPYRRWRQCVSPKACHPRTRLHGIIPYGVAPHTLTPSWRWRQYDPLQLAHSSTRLHGIITQRSPIRCLPDSITSDLNTHTSLRRLVEPREQRVYCSARYNIAQVGKCSSVKCFPLSSCRQFLQQTSKQTIAVQVLTTFHRLSEGGCMETACVWFSPYNL
jgi:hypothetical protein